MAKPSPGEVCRPLQKFATTRAKQQTKPLLMRELTIQLLVKMDEVGDHSANIEGGICKTNVYCKLTLDSQTSFHVLQVSRETLIPKDTLISRTARMIYAPD
eukprot:IDg13530t1